MCPVGILLLILSTKPTRTATVKRNIDCLPQVLSYPLTALHFSLTHVEMSPNSYKHSVLKDLQNPQINTNQILLASPTKQLDQQLTAD